jgi:hypothetical protein
MGNNSSSLLDLLDLPSLPQRIVRVLLKKQPLNVEGILAELQAQEHAPAGLTKEIVKAAVKMLVDRDILVRVPHLPFSYEVRLPQTATKDQGSELWDKAGITVPEDASWIPHPEAPRDGEPNTITEPRSRPLGRRVLPDVIWEKLEGRAPRPTTDGDAPEDEKKPKTGTLRGDLFDALDP